MERFFVFSLDELRLALPLAAVDRVFQAVYVTRLPDAPDIVLGVIDVQGEVIPVVDIRSRFALPGREIALNDRMIIARTGRRTIAFVANSVSGVVEYPESEMIEVAAILPDLSQVTGVVKLDEGLIFIHHLGRLLSLDEEETLDQALLETIDC